MKEYKLYTECQQHHPLDMFELKHQQQYFCFTFVRNPWDRCVSEYIYARDGVINYRGSFDEFIIEPRCSPYHMETQCSFINDNIDYVGKFETFDQDMQHVCDRLNIKYTPYHENKSDHMHYKKYYNETTKSLVAYRYRDDIEMFQYTF